MNIQKILKSYIKDPEPFWEGNTRQAGKSFRRIDKLLRYYGLENESLAKIILEVAKSRINNSVPTIYISSFGSSGSHLVQHVLVESLGFIGLGEIYLPPLLERDVNNDSSDNKVLIESYHLLHSAPEVLFSNKKIINTAHKARLQGFFDNTANFQSAFLLRDPVDICISRTFRKGEYRSYLGMSDLSDEEYLKTNIVKTKKFYRSALSHPYDQYFFYEDFLHFDYSFATKVAKFVGAEGNVEAVYRSLKSSIQTGASNKYKGPFVTIPERYHDMAKAELAEVIESYEKLRKEK